MDVRLKILEKSDYEEFIRNNQYAFNYGASRYFSEQELFDLQEDDGHIISKDTILNSLNQEGSIAYRIFLGEIKVGGIIVNLKDDFGELEIFFVNPEYQSKGIGEAAWKEIEKLHPNIKIWETLTPYFEQRNIHFYVN